MVRPTMTFFCYGLGLWLFCGFFAGLLSFTPAVDISTIKDNQEMINSISSAWIPIFFKTVGLWALAGGIAGVITSWLFRLRPDYERNLLLRPVASMPQLPFMQRPKTMAELATTFQSNILAVIISAGLTFFVLPLWQNEIIVIDSILPRLFVILQTFMLNVLVLPFSLKSITKQIMRAQVTHNRFK